jgi:16S rRNA (adenine1518-N6/adenine1519-N6)-dimethyltransferase
MLVPDNPAITSFVLLCAWMKKKSHVSRGARLGQHFLSDHRFRDRILEAFQPRPDDLVIEIGSGRGFLTEALAPRVKKLWAIEIDARWAATLKAAFINSKRVEVLREDILKVNFEQFAQEGGGVTKLRVVGNLPYYITSPILFHLFDQGSFIRDALLMVQTEVAERLTALPNSRQYGFASLATQLYSRPRMLFRVPPSSFSPPPRVHSSIIHLELSARADELLLDDVGAFLKFAQQIFLEKRKTLLNNLKRFIPNRSEETPLQILQALADCSLDSKVRAENVSLEATAWLYRTLRHQGFL